MHSNDTVSNLFPNNKIETSRLILYIVLAICISSVIMSLIGSGAYLISVYMIANKLPPGGNSKH